MPRANKAVRRPDADSGTVRIMVVDDHPIVRKGMVELIQAEADLEVRGEASEASEALAVIDEVQPHLAVIDIGLDGTDGIELVKQIRSRGDEVKILVTSMHDETLYAERALSAGAQGYINKSEATDSIISAIRQLLRGKVYLSPKMTEHLLHRVIDGNDDINRTPVDSLSDRELEVFRLIGNGLTTRQIADILHLSVKTIETYRDHIKTKLNLENTTQLIRRAVQWSLQGT